MVTRKCAKLLQERSLILSWGSDLSLLRSFQTWSVSPPASHPMGAG